MYHILMKRQIIRLYNDISNIKMDKRIGKMIFFLDCFDQRCLT